MPRVLVTGSTGVIGSVITKHLRSLDFEVVEFRDKSGNRTDLRIMDPSKQIVQDIDFIVHCASPIPLRDIAIPEVDLANDICQIDMNVMKSAVQLNARVLYLSTCGLYDRSSETLKTEDDISLPRAPYFEAKYAGEKLFSNYTDSVSLRISSPYGEKIHRSTVVAKFLHCVDKNTNITLWGTGKREQDFICTTDIARFVSQQISKWNSGIFNVVSGSPLTMLEVATLITADTSSKIEFSGKSDPEEGMYSRYSALKSRNILEWEAKESIQVWIENFKIKAGLS
jgi:UDP-glucose 4-epimerase